MALPPLIPAAALHLAESCRRCWRRSCTCCCTDPGAHARARAPPGAGWRVASFVFGVVLVMVVQLPPLDNIADQVLVAHMIQHLVIGDIASLFIVLGLTGPVIGPLLHMRATRPLRVLASPGVALVAVGAQPLPVARAVLLPAGDQPRPRPRARARDLAVVRTLLWLALIGPLPKPAWFNGWGMLGYVIAIRLIGAVLANVLLWSQTVFYPVYRATDAARGLNPLSDQNLAGGAMMVEESILTILLLGWLFFRFAKQDEERQELLDLAASRGFELSDERAARAAKAGTTAQLRERILQAAPGQPSPGSGPAPPDRLAGRTANEGDSHGEPA